MWSAWLHAPPDRHSPWKMVWIRRINCEPKMAMDADSWWYDAYLHRWGISWLSHNCPRGWIQYPLFSQIRHVSHYRWTVPILSLDVKLALTASQSIQHWGGGLPVSPSQWGPYESSWFIYHPQSPWIYCVSSAVAWITLAPRKRVTSRHLAYGMGPVRGWLPSHYRMELYRMHGIYVSLLENMELRRILTSRIQWAFPNMASQTHLGAPHAMMDLSLP